jgi:hypothetical protein
MRHDAVLGEGGEGDAGSSRSLLRGQEGAEETLTLKMTNKTFDTFASDWTQCTNVAFDKLLRKFQLQNAGHKVPVNYDYYEINLYCVMHKKLIFFRILIPFLSEFEIRIWILPWARKV